MKKFAIASWTVALMSACFLLWVVACGARQPVASQHDASFPGPHRLGVNFIEAGVDSGFIGDSGLLTFTLASPITPPFGDAPITAIEVRSVGIDLVAGTATVMVGSVGGDPQRTRQLVIQLGAASETQFTNAIKAQLASQYGLTFQ